MINDKELKRIQAVPDALVHQVYAKDSQGRKRLDHVVWSSKLLGLEVTLPCGVHVPAGTVESHSTEDGGTKTMEEPVRRNRQERKE
jgi:hypothetical protein